MKEVMAIIRMSMADKTRGALAEAGISSLHTKECLGIIEMPRDMKGAPEEGQDMLREPEPDGRLVPMRMIDVIVPDKLVKTVVNTVIRVNKTGRSGDGKIFVLPVSESWQVRTGRSGDEVLDT
jgi:nitrogen regulatory protein PII 2